MTISNIYFLGTVYINLHMVSCSEEFNWKGKGHTNTGK